MTTYYIHNKDEDKYEEVKSFTKEDIDGIVGSAKWFSERLERERAKYSDYDELKQKAETLKSNNTELSEKLTTLEEAEKDFNAKLAEANLNANKQEVLRKFNLSDDVAEFVTGDNKDEMLRRAEKLSKTVQVAPSITKSEKGEPEKNEFAKMRDELLGSSDD